jgi:hypothetical protein
MTQEFVTSNGGGGACWSAPPPTNLDLAANGGLGGARTASGAQRRKQGGLFAADMELSLDQLPIRKRYLKSHSGGCGWDGGTATTAVSGDDELSGSGSPAGGKHCVEEKSAGDLDARLRAGVIRHSSDPKRCLAYYYANKNPS